MADGLRDEAEFAFAKVPGRTFEDRFGADKLMGGGEFVSVAELRAAVASYVKLARALL